VKIVSCCKVTAKKLKRDFFLHKSLVFLTFAVELFKEKTDKEERYEAKVKDLDECGRYACLVYMGGFALENMVQDARRTCVCAFDGARPHSAHFWRFQREKSKRELDVRHGVAQGCLFGIGRGR
jgi:hypothetical protein